MAKITVIKHNTLLCVLPVLGCSG